MQTFSNRSAACSLAMALCCSLTLAAPAQSTRPSSRIAASSAAGEIVHSGTVEPAAKVDVPSSVRGILAEVNVKEGQAVSKGEQLAKLDDALQQAQMHLAQLEAEQTSEIQGARNQIDFAQHALDMLAGKGTQSEVQEKKLQLEQSKLALQVQLDKQQQAKVKLEQEQITLAHMTLRSPIDGYVLTVHKHAGEQTDEGPVITVVQTSKVNAVFFLPKAFFGKVKVGDRVPLDLEGQSREGTVATIDPIIDAGLFRVKLEVDNADAKIPAGINVFWHWKK